MTTWKTLEWTGEKLLLLDQRRLPAEEVTFHCESAAEVVAGIREWSCAGRRPSA